MAAYKQARKEDALRSGPRCWLCSSSGGSDPRCSGLSPVRSLKSAQIADFIIDVCGDRLSNTGRNFVRVLAENRRLGLMSDIVAGFEAERARDERRSDVVVTAAYELS